MSSGLGRAQLRRYYTHTEIHAHTDTNTSSFSLCSPINAVSPTGTEVDAHIHTQLSHQLRVCIDLSLQQWCLFGFYIVFCSSSYISVYDPNTHTNTATHAQTHTARYTHRYTHLCNIISFVVSEHFLELCFSLLLTTGTKFLFSFYF